MFGIASSILIDFSRSLWVGAAIGLAAVVVLWRKSKHCSTQVSLIGMIAAVLAFSFLFVAFVAKTNRFEAYQIAHGRGEIINASTQSMASVSRMRLLAAMKPVIAQHPLFGSGFGTPVTFLTEDPRAISNGGTDPKDVSFGMGTDGTLDEAWAPWHCHVFYGWLGLLMVKTARMIRREVHGPLNPIAGAFLAATIGIIGVDF